MSNEVSRWDQRYAEGRDGWTLERAPLVLDQLIASFTGPEPLRVLVPAAGHGVDAFAWARAGHTVTAIDFAPRAVASMRVRSRELGLELEILEADVTAPPPELRGRVDLVWEQTCLCALPPESRAPYLEAMAALLRPRDGGDSGQMFALLWHHGNEGGPPHDMPPAFVEELIVGRFHVTSRHRVDDSLSTRSVQYLWRLRPVVAVP